MLTQLRQEMARLASCDPAIGLEREGRVLSCDGRLVTASGLTAPVGSLCQILAPDGRPASQAEVVGFRDSGALLLLLGEAAALQPGARVRVGCSDTGTVAVGRAFRGRAVDGLGQPIDGGPPVRPSAQWPLGGERTGALERASVTQPFDCGVRAINALATLGVGQRAGIIAGSGVGKSVLIDMIAAHAECDVAVVALIGERAREVSDFVNRHMQGPKRERTVVVAVPADHPASLRLRGARFATALAEYFRAQGKRVLLILDSLTRVAHAAREVALLLGEPAAARGYPPSALAAITALVERAGNSVISGGAVTGLYTVLADGDDPNDPVVDTARAILDGHIVLSRALAERGQYPAIDVPASLSRVMDALAGPEHQTLARQFRRAAADYEANRDLVVMGAYQPGADPQVDRAMALQPALAAFLRQEPGEGCRLGDSRQALAQVLADERP